MKKLIILTCCFMLSACGFKLQGEKTLAQPLRTLYLQTPDRYDVLERNLREHLRMSGVHLVSSPNESMTQLIIVSDETSQELLSVSGTQQTRQYNLRVTVQFQLLDAKGNVILPLESLTDTRTITVQSNQILGSSNEASVYYQQIRRGLANAIMNRIASAQVTNIINHQFIPDKKHKK